MSDAALRPMTVQEYAEFLSIEIPGYGADRAKADATSRAEGEATARRQLAAILPDGSETPGHVFFAVVESEVRVGWLWLALRGVSPDARIAILEIRIDEQHRGRGLGRAVMGLVEEEARRRGAWCIELNVFGHNPRALRLYESLGYEPTAINMRKGVAEPPVAVEWLSPP